MKRFLVRILIFLIIVFAADRVMGSVLSKAYNHDKVDYICNKCDEEILIFGSSRAESHYNARMIEDSLGISAFNCGASGYGIINSLGYLKMILKHHRPQIVIYDVWPQFDLDRMDNHRFLGHLKPYYDNECIKELFIRVDPLEKYKMQSLLYRYNSHYLHKPNKYFTSDYDKKMQENRGFKPKNKPFKKPEYNNTKMTPFLNDTLKVNMFHEFLCALGDSISVIAVVSPIWSGSSEKVKQVINLFEKHSIPIYDFSNNSKYVHHDDYFYNDSHMNATGADEFTKDIIAYIKQELSQKQKLKLDRLN